MSDSVLAGSPDGLRAGATTPGVKEVLGYVVVGRARFEFGPGGIESVDVETGGFFHVPAGLVHRDVNPLDSLQEIVMTVVGSGPPIATVA